jgi:hypothetical protein
MIARRLRAAVLERLQQVPAVALLGPRQVGKTTLAREIAETFDSMQKQRSAVGPGLLGGPRLGGPRLGPTVFEPSLYLDLESEEDRRKLTDAAAYLRAYENRLVVLDEVHRAPELFQTLRGLIDEGRAKGLRSGRFLLLGSASMELLKESVESLAGRLAYLELAPFDILEAGPESAERLWTRGGFPDSYLAGSDAESARWRLDFIRTYLQRDIPAFGFSIPAETLRRFWTMLAHAQGQLLNAAALAKSLSVEGKSVARYVDLLRDLLLVRRLEPYHANVKKRLVKSPKIYIRDSGILHSLLGLGDREALLGHSVAGASWEGFVLENLMACAPGHEANFYRTSAGAEIDLVLTLSGSEVWAVEIKRGAAPSLTRGFHAACEDIRPDRTFVVYSGVERYPLKHGVEMISLPELCRELAAHS